MSSPQKTDESDNETYRKVAGLTCVSMFSCCSLVESVVEDLVQRLAQFFEEAEIEFKQQRHLLAEAFEAGDVEKMIGVIEKRSSRYGAAVDRLLGEGRTAATRSFRKLHESIDITSLTAQLKLLDEEFVPPACYRQKRRTSYSGDLVGARGSTSVARYFMNSASEFSAAVTPYNECIKRLTELKMTPKLASAASRFQGDLLRPQISKAPTRDVDEDGDDDSDDEEEEELLQDEVFSPNSVHESMTCNESENEHMESLPPADERKENESLCNTARMSLAAHSLQVNGGPLSAFERPTTSANCTPLNAEISVKYNCETIMEERHSDHQQPHLLQDPGSNILMTMFKSPLLKIQEKFGLGSLKRACPPTPKTPVRQIKSSHRLLKPLPPKKTCVRPDQDELMVYAETRASQLAPWGATMQYHTMVVQQQDWNPYSIFGLGVRVIAYEDVFKTPDFRLLARTAASELRAGCSNTHKAPGRETRIERWYKDSNGYNTGEGMTNKQLECMVTALKKKVDLSHLAYQDTWQPCDENCTHNSAQPWVKLES